MTVEKRLARLARIARDERHRRENYGGSSAKTQSKGSERDCARVGKSKLPATPNSHSRNEVARLTTPLECRVLNLHPAGISQSRAHRGRSSITDTRFFGRSTLFGSLISQNSQYARNTRRKAAAAASAREIKLSIQRASYIVLSSATWSARGENGRWKACTGECKRVVLSVARQTFRDRFHPPGCR